MAEKRLKDRLTLKLISAYEYGGYSEEEADDFKRKKESTPTQATPKQQNFVYKILRPIIYFLISVQSQSFF